MRPRIDKEEERQSVNDGVDFYMDRKAINDTTQHHVSSNQNEVQGKNHKRANNTLSITSRAHIHRNRIKEPKQRVEGCFGVNELFLRLLA